MIISRQAFEFKGRAVIEKLIIKSPFRFEALFQNEGCFLYISGAKATFNSPDQKIQVNPKESVLLKCGSYFVDWPNENDQALCEVYAFHLYPDLLKQIYRSELPSYISRKKKGEFIQKILPDHTLSKFIEGLHVYCETPSLVNEELLELKLKELILILLHTKNSESIIQLVSELFLPRHVSIREVMNTHIYSDISISKLAEFSNLSTSSFKREFEKIYNDSPKNYIITKRLERAMELLISTEATISAIAYEVGFSDPAYFSRLYKKKFKIAPRAAREK